MRGQVRSASSGTGICRLSMSLKTLPVKTVVKVTLGAHEGGRAERPVSLNESWAAGWLSSSTPVYP